MIHNLDCEMLWCESRGHGKLQIFKLASTESWIVEYDVYLNIIGALVWRLIATNMKHASDAL